MYQYHYNRRLSARPCNYLRYVIRIFGIVTSFVICGVGVDVYLHGFIAGLFTIICSVLILFCEVKWIITLFLQLILEKNHLFCLQCWNYCRIFGGWRLAPPYIAFGIALIVWPHNLWLSHVAGFLLLLLALLRLCTVIKCINTNKDEGLLPQCDFENYEDTIENSYTEVIPSLEDDEPIDDTY